jgi:hypothetical protein
MYFCGVRGNLGNSILVRPSITVYADFPTHFPVLYYEVSGLNPNYAPFSIAD